MHASAIRILWRRRNTRGAIRYATRALILRHVAQLRLGRIA